MLGIASDHAHGQTGFAGLLAPQHALSLAVGVTFQQANFATADAASGRSAGRSVPPSAGRQKSDFAAVKTAKWGSLLEFSL